MDVMKIDNDFNHVSHINHRNSQYNDIQDSFGMTTIEINPTELCNRKCNFCPRSEWYPNSNDNLSKEDAKIIKNRLDEFNYKGIVIISGKGEPMLNPSIYDIVETLNDRWVELITNGDRILKQPKILDKLYDKGLSRIILDEYDNQINFEKKKKLLNGRPGAVKNHFNQNLQSQIYNNRSGSFETISDSLKRKCYFPFYKGYIDWNLEMRFCCNDWKYKETLGNLKNNTIEELWMSEKMNKYRKSLSKGNRCDVISCKKCDADGLLLGEKSFKKLLDMI